MNKLDKMIKRERKAKYKRLKRLRVARDMASKHVGKKLLLSKVLKHYKSYCDKDSYITLHYLAKDILDNHRTILGLDRPPAPPIRKVGLKR